MPSYTEVTKQIGDQWVNALGLAGKAITASTAGAQNLPQIDVSQVPVPEPVAKFNEAVRRQLDEAIGDKLPKPNEIVAANFELTQRLMAAQRDLTLRLLELSPSGDPTATTNAGTASKAKSAAKA